MVITLVKNQLKRGKPRVNQMHTKNIVGVVLLAILTATILGIFGYILFLLTHSFARLRLPDIYLKTVFFILIVVLTVFEIFNIIKELFQSKDNQIYLKLPITKEQLFMSKMIYLYIRQLIISLVFLAVTAGVYGLVETDITIFYYVRLVVVAFVIPFLSLIISSFLSIPVSAILGFLKKHKTILLLSLIFVIGVFFVVYIQFINVVLSFINLTSLSSSPVIDPLVIEGLRNATDGLLLSNVFYNLLMNEQFIMNLLIIIAVISVLMVGVYFLLKYYYFKTLNKQNERIDIKIKKEIKMNQPAVAILKKEFKTMLRNPDYAFQAIVLNLLMPTFIYLTIRLTYRAGEVTVGQEIVPGITLMTMLIFILLTNSFQGMIVSREKEAYFIMRITPMKILKQLFSKLAIGYLLNLFMILVTIVLITSFGFITVIEAVVIGILSILFSTGYTLILVSSDYKNPQITTNVAGFEEGLNMYKNLFVGLLLSIVVGILFSVTPFIRKLFEFRRVFSVLDIFIVMIDKTTVNYALYGTVIVIIFVYVLIGFLSLRKVVKL